jgi:RNA polymerase sigma-70 factor (ECF subfamily)
VLDDDSREEKSKLNLRTERSDQEESIVNRLTMEKAMELLTEQEKSIVDLKLLGGLTFREISELLNMPMGTVTWHYNSGIKRLRRYLNHD